MNGDGKTAFESLLEDRIAQQNCRRQEELTVQMATIVLGAKRAGNSFYFKSEHQLQLFARLCENAGALAVSRTSPFSRALEETFMQRGRDLLKQATECRDRDDKRRVTGNAVLDKAVEIVRQPEPSYGYVDVGDCLVKYLRGEYTERTASEILDDLDDDYRLSRLRP